MEEYIGNMFLIKYAHLKFFKDELGLELFDIPDRIRRIILVLRSETEVESNVKFNSLSGISYNVRFWKDKESGKIKTEVTHE